MTDEPRKLELPDLLPRPLSGVKKFYFLDYLYILLRSAAATTDLDEAFEIFKNLKEKFWLGESKYKTKIDTTSLSPVQETRYLYTFRQIIEEAKDYRLVFQRDRTIHLRATGAQLLNTYAKHGKTRFNERLATLMEGRFMAFRQLTSLLYTRNNVRGGLIVFPLYSPRQLGFDRSQTVFTKDFIAYTITLYKKIEEDLQVYLDKQIGLKDTNKVLVNRLLSSGLLPAGSTAPYNPDAYNVLTKRVRDFWINYMLKELYGYDHSLSSFDIWTYRAKQVGVLQTTEFYPGFSGRIVYPTAIISNESPVDFHRLYQYPDGQKLLIHKPKWETAQESFVQALVNAYFQLRRGNNNYYISLTALREIVCYKLKISDHIFEQFLEAAYRLNISGELKIKISLEVDKLPEETKAMYLKQEPVTIDGKSRNIIAIDITKDKQRV